MIEKAFAEGYVKPSPPETRTGKKVAVIGSGPAGLACADTLNKFGHIVTIYEADEAVGGYLRFGIPDFKLDKSFIDRRVNILQEEGISIKTGIKVGRDIDIKKIKQEYDAVCLAIGARKPRDLNIEGRELKGVHFAMEYLLQQNMLIREEKIPDDRLIRALDKNVIVIGGGDTGADCVGTANRQGAKSVVQIELLPEPSRHRTEDEPWPMWPKLFKTSSSHEEGCQRIWSVLTKKIVGENGKVTKLHGIKVEWSEDESGKFSMKEIPASDFELNADLILLAMGFLHPEHDGIIDNLDIKLDNRGNIAVDENFMTSISGFFAAGDAYRGASLVVWAIQDGRCTAKAMNKFLSGK